MKKRTGQSYKQWPMAYLDSIYGGMNCMHLYAVLKKKISPLKYKFLCKLYGHGVRGQARFQREGLDGAKTV